MSEREQDLDPRLIELFRSAEVIIHNKSRPGHSILLIDVRAIVGDSLARIYEGWLHFKESVEKGPEQQAKLATLEADFFNEAGFDPNLLRNYAIRRYQEHSNSLNG